MNKVICPICHKSYNYINNFHLKTHGYSSEKEFKKDYPNAVLKSSEVINHIDSHLNSLNTNSELQSIKAKKLWASASDEFKDSKRKQLREMTNQMKLLDPDEYRRIHLFSIQGSRHDYKLPDGTILKLRSFLECRVARFLLMNNLEFEYESLRYEYNYKGHSHGYVPDFYIPKYNMIIEVKPICKQDDPIVQAKKNSVNDHRFMFIGEDIKDNFNDYLSVIKF